jgi:hypothetical protein
VFASDFDWRRFRYYTEIKHARPLSVLASRRYEQDDEGLTVINAGWEIVADCFQLAAADDVGPVAGYEDARLTGSIQFYLPADEERNGQVISARLKAEELSPRVEGVRG